MSIAEVHAQQPQATQVPAQKPALAPVTVDTPLQAGFDRELFLQWWDELGVEDIAQPGYIPVVAPRATRDRAGRYLVDEIGRSTFPGSEMTGERLISIPTGTPGEQALEMILPLISDSTQSVYVKINVFQTHLDDKPGVPGVKRANAHLVRGFFMDLDCAGGAHSESDLPTRQQAEEFIQQLPVAPTITDWTGGGFHLFFLLDEALPAADKAPAEKIAAGMKESLLNFFDRAGRGAADVAPTTDYLARWTRAAGFMNAKRPAAPELVDMVDAGLRASAEELLVAFPAPPVPERVTASAEQREARGKRPGDRFASAVSVEWVAAQMGAKRQGDSLNFPRPDGSYSSSPSVSIYPDSDGAGDKMYSHGDRVPRQLKARILVGDPSRLPQQLSSFDLLAWGWCEGDYALSARLVTAFEDRSTKLFNLDGISDALAPKDFAELSARFPSAPVRLEAVPEIESPLAPVTALPSAMRLEDAALAGVEAQVIIPGPEPLLAMVSPVPGRTGIFRYQADNADPIGQVIENWIAIPIVHRTSRLIASGTTSRAIRRQTRPGGEPDDLVDVMVVIDDGRYEIVNDLTLKELSDMRVIERRTQLPAALPTTASARALFAAAHKKLRDSQERPEMTFFETGYAELPGGPAYLAMGGSVDQAGLRTDLKLEVEGEDGPSQVVQDFGFRTLPTDPAVVGRLISGMLAIGQRRVMVPILGQALAGFVPCGGSLGTMIVSGSSDSGKSWGTAIAITLTGREYNRNAFVASLANGSTSYGLEKLAEFFHDAPIPIDDYRQSGEDKNADARAAAALDRYTMLSYGGVPVVRGGKDGSVRSAAPANFVGMLSAEVTPVQTAIRNRSVVVHATKGDFDTLGSHDNSAITRYRQLSLDHDPSQVSVILIQWILHLIALEGFQRVTERYQSVRDTYQAYAAEQGLRARAVEVATPFVVGITALRDALAHRGAEWSAAAAPFLPSDDELKQIFLRLVQENTRATEEESVARRTVRSLAEKISLGGGHLNFFHDPSSAVSTHLVPEPDQAGLMGWKRVGSEVFAQGESLGFMSRDGRYVHITLAGMSKTRESLRLGLSAAAHRDYLKEVALVADSKPLRKHFPEGTGKRQPGYTFDATTFFGYEIGSQEETENE